MSESEQQRSGQDGTPRSEALSRDDTVSKLEKQHTRTSKKLSEQSGVSKKLWLKPKNVREFAAQANDVATMVLNGEISTRKARTYSAVARHVCQSFNIEAQRARMTKEVPVLDIEEKKDD